MKYFHFDILSELQFRTSRSGGSGGQHVNKTESKVEVIFNIEQSVSLDEETKVVLLTKLSTKVKEGSITVYAQTSRSQNQNKEEAIAKLLAVLDKAMQPVMKRKKTKPSKAAKEKRIQHKKRKSEIKESRRKREY